MSESQYFRIRNWEKYQSFNKDRPNWIKLHTRLLDDYDFHNLSDFQKLLWYNLLLFAAQTRNNLPYDRKHLRNKLGTNKTIRDSDLAGLFDAGFLEWCNDGNTAVTHPLHSRGRGEREKNPLPQQAGESEPEKGNSKPKNSRVHGTNPRAMGTNPRAIAGKEKYERQKQLELEKKIDREIDDAWAETNAVTLAEWKASQQPVTVTASPEDDIPW